MTDTVGEEWMTQDAEVQRLRTELGRTKRALQQREEALTVLNRRLLRLERLRGGSEGMDEASDFPDKRAEFKARLAASAHALEELERMRATKLFRYTAPVRKIYGVLRGL